MTLCAKTILYTLGSLKELLHGPSWMFIPPLAAAPWRQMLHQQQQLIVSGRTTAYQVSQIPGTRELS